MSTKTEPKDSEKMAVATGTPTAANRPRAAAASRPRRAPRPSAASSPGGTFPGRASAVGVVVRGVTGAGAGRDGARRGGVGRGGDGLQRSPLHGAHRNRRATSSRSELAGTAVGG